MTEVSGKKKYVGTVCFADSGHAQAAVAEEDLHVLDGKAVDVVAVEVDDNAEKKACIARLFCFAENV